MEKYNLTQTGQEVQDILDNATPQSDLASEVERAQEAERLLGEGIQQNADDIDAIEAKIPSAATSENKLTDKEYVDGQVDDEKNRAQGAEGTLQDNIDAEEARAKAAEKQNADDIDALESVVPSGATSENKLATESYVNDAVATSSATFRGTFNLVSDLHLTLEATHANIATALAAAIATADNNDFAFVLIPTDAETPTVIGSIERYKYNGTDWAYEYTLNNSGFTQAQWDAINSGITSGDVAKLAALPTNAQLTTLLAGLQSDIDGEEARAKGAEGTLQDNIDAEEARAKAAEKQNADDIDAIEAVLPENASSENKVATESEIDSLSAAIEAILLLIPSAASSLNQLADKAFVNSSISTATATFRGTFNLVNDLHLTLAATHAQIGNALALAILDSDNNDYCFVQIPTVETAPNEIAQTDRYKFNGSTWEYEYTLNNSGFTSTQWIAINSGITSALVTKLSALPTNTDLTTALGVLTSSITAINQKIPAAAAQNNKLVDTAALEAYIIQVLDVLTVTYNVTSSDGHVTLAIQQTDGKITSVSLTTSDIASAAVLDLKASQADLTALANRVTTAEGNITTLGGRVSTNETDIAQLQAAYEALTQSDIIIGALPASGVANKIYRVPGTNSYSDYMWNGTQFVLMATYNNAIDPRPKKGSTNLVESGGIFDNMGALDISELNATENPHTLATYADLSAALAAIPSNDYKKGGMSIKFVQTDDNKYVQYRLMATSFSTTPSDWQGVDSSPVKDSPNLVESGGVFDFNNLIFEAVGWGTSLPQSASEGDYYLFGNSYSQQRIYEYVSSSWVEANSLFSNKPMIWIIKDTQQLVYKKNNLTQNVDENRFIEFDKYLLDYIRKSYIIEAIGMGESAPESDYGNDGDYYLQTSVNNRKSWHKESDSWVDAKNAVYTNYGYNVIWKVNNRFYMRKNNGINDAFFPLDDYAANLAINARDKQIKFYNLYSDNNNTKFASKEAARQYWGTKFGYTNSAGTVLFYILTNNTYVLEQKVNDAQGTGNYYLDENYKDFVLGNPPLKSDFLSEDNSFATILNKPLGVQKYQERLGTVNYDQVTNVVIDGELFIKSTNRKFGEYTIIFPQNKVFSCELEFYAQNAGTLETSIYDSTDSKYIYQVTKTLVAGHNKIRVSFKPSTNISTHSTWIRFVANSAVGTLYLKDSTRYYTFTDDNPVTVVNYDEDNIDDSLSDFGKQIVFNLVDFTVDTTTAFGFQADLGYGGTFYITLKKTGDACPFAIYGNNVTGGLGSIVAKIDSSEDFSTEKTFILKLDRTKRWYVQFRTWKAGVTIDKLLIERPVSKSSLSEWAGKILSIYGDSIAAITNANNGRGPIWNSDSMDYGQKIAHYYHLGSVYGRGIGSQMYKWNNGHGGALCWVDSTTGQYKGRLNNRTYDDYLNSSLTDTVVAEATAAGYDSNTMTFCRGSLSSWDRITKMYPASIKDSIDAIVVMSVNDSYDDVTNHTWLDYSFADNDETDPEWAASTYYATYGGDYNISTSLQGGIASTVMKLQAWMPQARILLCVSGAGGRYNTVHTELAEQEFTKYDSIIKMHRLLSCPLVDIYGTAGINGLNCMNYLNDGIHPYTAAGGRAYAAAIIGAMNGVVLHSSLI